ncbi:MAG: tRNA pseudouridine(54/55) synthase Pus10 [Thermoproteota archaeon]|nr:tRNA pseudouridine(54/55) synthase Pus10 [Thermoproteota archaeon]
MEILEKTRSMIERYPLCSYCLGRQFALLGQGISNEKRGEVLKLLLTMQAHQQALSGRKAGVKLLKTLATNGFFSMAEKLLKKMGKRVKRKHQSCYLCEDCFEFADELAEKSLEKLDGVEYSTFLVGVKLPVEVEERADEFKAEFEVTHGESIRNGFSRVIGKKIAQATRKEVNYKNPEVVVLINPFTKQVKLQLNPLYITGRYRKLVRGIPQSKWLCPKCQGEGCEQCNWTGKMYPESVEEFIAEPVLEKTGGQEASFHASGREDIDARMLGRGRPFVIEIKKPIKRFLNLENLEKTINRHAEKKVEVRGLHLSDKDSLRKLKKWETAQKLYRILVEFDREVSDEELSVLEKALTKIMVHQQTPQRVLHRRANRVREKYIYETKVKRLTPNKAEIRVRCQGGLYVKELITGDEGRTKPNVAGIIHAETTPLELDVLNVFIGKQK